MELTPSKEELSRTRKKKHSHQLQKMGERLVDLTPAQLRQLDLPEELLEALTQARNITRHGARRRQMQYIGRIMLQVDEERLVAALDRLEYQCRRPIGASHPPPAGKDPAAT